MLAKKSYFLSNSPTPRDELISKETRHGKWGEDTAAGGWRLAGSQGPSHDRPALRDPGRGYQEFVKDAGN